jgi:hypothetical protein
MNRGWNNNRRGGWKEKNKQKKEDSPPIVIGDEEPEEINGATDDENIWSDFKEPSIQLLDPKDIGLTFDKIHFIQKEDDKMFDYAFEQFKEQKVAAFDLEEFWGKTLELIQLSTNTDVFIFDVGQVQGLIESEKLKEKLLELYRSEEIAKVSFFF